MKNLLSFMKAPEPALEKKGAYVLSHTIAGISDCFDAAEIWSQPSIMRHSQNRLRGLLAAHAYRRGNTKQVHEHVIIELPAAAVADDRRIGRGETCKMLELELARLHYESFKTGKPRFQVQAAIELADDEVRVRLGHGIYLPNVEETSVWKLESSIDGTIWRDLADITENQRLVVLGKQAECASYVCADWPFDEAVQLVLINAPEQCALEIGAQPIRSLTSRFDSELGCYVIAGLPEPVHGQAYGQEKRAVLYLRSTRLASNATQPKNATNATNSNRPVSAHSAPTKKAASAPASNSTPISAKTGIVTTDNTNATQAQAAHGQAAIRREPLMPLPAIPAMPVAKAISTPPTEATSVQVWRKGQANAAALASAENAAQDEEDGTFVPGKQRSLPVETAETWLVGVVPLHQPKLVLVGLALQRPSLYQEYGIRALSFGVDAHGKVRPPKDSACALRFTISPDDSLSVETKNGKRGLKPGEKLPLPAGGMVAVHELPAAMQNSYLAWLSLPNGPGASLTAGKELTVGRDRRLLDLGALRLLAGKGFIQADSNPSGDCMGISSEHCKIMLADQTLSISVIGKMPMALLDADYSFLRMLGQGEHAHVTHGQHLVLGHYVWQFRRAPGSVAPD